MRARAPRCVPLVLPVALLVALLVAPAASAPPADHATGEFVLTAPKGATYTLIVPDSYDRKSGATLLLWLHGAGDNHANAARGAKSFSLPDGWITAIPDARASGAWQMDEEDRVMDVVDQVVKAYHVRRLFIGGFSRGGFFTFGFGLNHTDRFVGYLCVGGGLPNPALAKKEDAEKIWVAILHGEADSVVPFSNATTTRDAFQKAGFKDRLFFRSTPGLGHSIDREALKAAISWLDANAASLSSPKDFHDYGMKLHGRGESGRAYEVLSRLKEEECGREDWWKAVVATRKKIEDAAEKDGKKVKKAIEAGRDAKWVPEWRAYDRTYGGVPFHGEVLAAFTARVAAQDEAAGALWTKAAAAKDTGDAKGAIEACLAIRDDCYVAAGEPVAKAKALLADFRADPAIMKKHRRLLKDTENWK
ncbi:MAG: hypothetical protein MUE73_17725 [Planctomycetes bacterium]|nr:hypothetical protein [Planctomycetota bacterium]